MLKKRFRLPVQTVVAKRSRSLRHNGFTLKVFESTLVYSRFNVVIPKASVKSAVKRNAIKRAAFVAFEKIQTQLVKPHDFLLVISKNDNNQSLKDGMIKELQHLFANL